MAFIKSQKTGENITPNFDYDKLENPDIKITNNDLKELVREVINLFTDRSSKDVPESMIIEELKTRFKLEEIPMQKIEDSLWYEYTKDERLGTAVQGFRQTTLDGKKIRIPHIGFSADLDYLNDFLIRLFEKYEKNKIEKLKLLNTDGKQI